MFTRKGLLETVCYVEVIHINYLKRNQKIFPYLRPVIEINFTLLLNKLL